MEIIDIVILVAVLTLFTGTLLISSNKRTKTKRKKWEENIYKQVLKELQNNDKRANLWKLALSEAEGSLEACKPIYIKYCVQSIIGEHEILETVRI